MAKEKNAVSIWFWLFAIVLAGLPCVGFFFSILFAFLGENETRKNYFKATLILQFLVFAILGMIAALGFAPALWELAKKMVDYLPKYLKGN